MTDFLHTVLNGVIYQLRLHPLTASIMLSSIVLVLLNAIIQDFLQIFQKRPIHFTPYRWSSVLRKSIADVPLVELGRHGHIPDALAQGSKLVNLPNPHGPKARS